LPTFLHDTHIDVPEAVRGIDAQGVVRYVSLAATVYGNFKLQTKTHIFQNQSIKHITKQLSNTFLLYYQRQWHSNSTPQRKQ
jgi:hypothetical protein